MINIIVNLVDSLAFIPISDTIDVLYSTTASDTILTESQSANIKNDTAFWTIIGGSISAILAAYFTNFFAKLNQNKKDRRIYEGFLYSIHTELHWHLSQTSAFKNQLGELKRVSIDLNKFAVSKAPNSYDVRYLEYCRQRILEYEQFDHEIVALLSTFINLLNEINVNVDFTSASMILSSNQDDNYSNHIRKYFEHIEKDNLDKISFTIPLLRSMIEEKLKSTPINLLIDSQKGKKVT